MNLDDLRKKIFSITDFAPDSEPYHTQIEELVSEAYYEVWTYRPWLFTLAEVELPLYRDITYARSTGNPTIAINKGERKVTFSANVVDLQYDWNHRHWVGQLMEISGRDFKIHKIVSATELWLAEPWRGTSLTAETDWSLKHVWYTLPADCISLASFWHTDKPFNAGVSVNPRAIPLHAQERMDLDYDRTSDYAQAIIKGPNLTVPAAGYMTIAWASSGVTNTFTEGDFYEFAWSFRKGEEIGPLSQTTVTEVNGGGSLAIPTFSLSMHDDTAPATPTRTSDELPYPLNYEGLDKVFFYNANLNPSTGVRRGPPKWCQLLNYDLTGGGNNEEWFPVQLDDSNYQITLTTKLVCRPSNPEYTPCSTYQTIRPYPRIDSADETNGLQVSPFVPKETFKRAIIRYIRKPKSLAYTTDVPEMPDEFHQLIVYKALENIYIRLNESQLSQLYAQRYMKEVRSLEKRYLAPGGDLQILPLGFSRVDEAAYLTHYNPPTWTG